MHFLSDVKKKLSRLFFGRIVVRELGELCRSEPTQIKTHFHDVDVRILRTVPRVGAALFVKWRGTAAVSAGSLMGQTPLKDFRVHSVCPVFRTGTQVKRYKLNLKIRARVRSALEKMKKMPMTRRNRLNFLKKQPKFEKASLLALYTPIYQEKVLKSALDKTSGNLLFWYDYDRVKAGEKSHLLLLRVFGGGEPLKWVWLSVNKKLY